MRISRLILVIFILFVALSLSTSGQQPPQQQQQQKQKADPRADPKKDPKAQTTDPEMVERAHEDLFNPKPKDSDAAAALTAEVAPHLPAGAKVSFDPVPRGNFIDEHVFGRIEAEKIPHAPLAADEEFLRRVYVDVAGVIPTADEARAFLDDKDPDKRDRLVDRLVMTDDYLHHWTYFFNDIFRVNVKMGRGKTLWHYWWRENLRANRSYAEMVREILTASGKTNHTVQGIALLSRENVLWKFIPDHPDDYWLLSRLDAFDEYSVLLYRAFLGINTSCISCHDGAGHLDGINVYLTGKTRKDFLAQSAFMGNTRMVMSYSFSSGLPMCTNYLVMDNTPNGYNTEDDSPWYTPSVTRIPRNGYGVVEPKFLLTDEVPRAGENKRDELARLITNHRQFARATVNRLWGAMMTFGIVEPIDEFDLGRLDPKSPPPKPWEIQPSNPALLEALTDEFIKSNYSLRHIIRTIAKSNAYQLSATWDAEWKDQYTRYHARRFVRQMTAYELIDSIHVATGVEGEYTVGSNGKVSRITQIASPEELRGRAAPALELARAFFLSNRDNPARPRIDGSARQALLLMNSPVVTSRVQNRGETRVAALLRQYKPKTEDDRLIRDLYLWSLSRFPSDQEMGVARTAVEKDRVKGVENLAWALLNNPEFLFNH